MAILGLLRRPLLSAPLVRHVRSRKYGVAPDAVALKQQFAAELAAQAGAAPETVKKPSSPGSIFKRDLAPAEVAFYARIGFNKVSPQPKALLPALLHPSAEPSNIAFPALHLLGFQTMRFMVNEFIMVKYPKLPLEDVRRAVAWYTSEAVLTDITNKYGLGLVAHVRAEELDAKPPLVNQCLLALLGLAVHEQKQLWIKKFMVENVFQRRIEKSKIFEPRLYKEWLFSLTKRLGFPAPAYRLEGETGRLSTSPMFLVGAYAGTDKLGEAYGPSIQLAEQRAAQDALERYYLEVQDDYLLRLPSHWRLSEAELADLKLPRFVPLPVHDTPAYKQDYVILKKP